MEYENQNCAKINSSKHPVTNGNATGVKQPRAANGREIHGHPMWATRQVYSQKVRSASLETNFHRDASVPSSQVTVLPQNSADKTGNVNLNQEIGRSFMCVEKRKRRSKAASVGCPSNVHGDHNKKVTSQDIECSSFNVNETKSSVVKTASVGYSNEIGVDKKDAFPKKIECSSAVSKRKKRSKLESISCSNQVGVDKTLTYRENERSSFDVQKGQQRSQVSSVEFFNKVTVGKKFEATQEIGRSSTVKKGKKRSHSGSLGFSNQTTASGFQAKKPQNERVAAQHRREIPVLSRLRKIIKEKAARNSRHSRMRTITRQRNLKGVELRYNTGFVGNPGRTKVTTEKPAKGKDVPFGELLNANLPLQYPGEESATWQNVLGAKMNAKRPLPVTPCFEEPADDAIIV